MSPKIVTVKIVSNIPNNNNEPIYVPLYLNLKDMPHKSSLSKEIFTKKSNMQTRINAVDKPDLTGTKFSFFFPAITSHSNNPPLSHDISNGTTYTKPKQIDKETIFDNLYKDTIIACNSLLKQVTTDNKTEDDIYIRDEMSFNYAVANCLKYLKTFEDNTFIRENIKLYYSRFRNHRRYVYPNFEKIKEQIEAEYNKIKTYISNLNTLMVHHRIPKSTIESLNESYDYFKLKPTANPRSHGYHLYYIMDTVEIQYKSFETIKIVERKKINPRKSTGKTVKEQCKLIEAAITDEINDADEFIYPDS